MHPSPPASGSAIGSRSSPKKGIEYVLIYYAALKEGVAVVSLNYRLAVPEWTYILYDARPRMLIAAGS